MPDTYEGPSINTTGVVYSGPYVPSFPFADQGDTAHVIFSQEQYQRAANYTAPTPGGTAVTINSVSVKLLGDMNISKDEAGLVKFTRRWANVPSTRYDYTRMAVSYPAYIEIRLSYNQTGLAQITHDYFRVGTGETYATPDLIPITAETRVTDTAGGNTIIFSDVMLNDGGGVVYATTPSMTTYLGYVTADASPASYSLVYDCDIKRYQSNIWERITRKMKAK